jgi:hypothetical protein
MKDNGGCSDDLREFWDMADCFTELGQMGYLHFVLAITTNLIDTYWSDIVKIADRLIKEETISLRMINRRRYRCHIAKP